MPRDPLRYVVLTGGGWSAGATIAYLLENTSIRISKIFLESSERPRRRTRKRAPGLTERLRLHLGLLRVLPRYYLFLVLERLTRVEVSDMVLCLANRPRLFRIVSGMEVPAEVSGRVRCRTIRKTAARYGIAIVETPDLNSEETVAALRRESPDVVIGLGTRILRPAVLEIPSMGCLNGHSSLLPEYRGGVTEFWQLVGGETETGVTIHWMADAVDAGDICAQRSWPIPGGYDHHKLRILSLFLLLEPWREVISRIEQGEVPRAPQGVAKTPTSRAPTLRMQYDFYCKRTTERS